MQLSAYNHEAGYWSESNPDPVVGSFHAHNQWKDYENLFSHISNANEKIALDFACGPGRNLVKYAPIFKRLDGVDISPVNIEKAKNYTLNNGITNINLYTNNGVDLSIIESNTYDVVMSTIALQHICVYEIRKSIFEEIYRILRSDGVFTAQMGFGSPSPQTVGYYENNYDAQGTNRACDVCIESPDQLEKDLISIGFKEFNYAITPVGPGDLHPNWIFFNARK